MIATIEKLANEIAGIVRRSDNYGKPELSAKQTEIYTRIESLKQAVSEFALARGREIEGQINNLRNSGY